MDCRLPENRLEAFKRITYTRLMEGDSDHHHSGRVITDMMGLTNEQKALYCLLFGQSYRNHWAMIMCQLFPDMLTMDVNVLQEWHDKNWKRSCYGKDTKWNVRKFPAFIKSVQDWLKGGSLYERLGEICSNQEVSKNYFALDKNLRSLHSIGRMTSWLTMQTVYEFFDFNIDHWHMQLEEPSTWSQYDSVCYFFDRLDIIRKKKIPNAEHPNGYTIEKYNPTLQNRKDMEKNCWKLMYFLNEELPFKVDIFNVESILCESRKTFYGPNIKEYTFWTSNELVEQYPTLKKAWEDYEGPGKVDWMPYVVSYMTKGPNVTKYGYSKKYFRAVVDHGINLNTHYYFEDERNAYDHLGLPKPEELTGDWKILVSEWEEAYSPSGREELKKKYDPRKFLKWKTPQSFA